jgi:hypothetical protein
MSVVIYATNTLGKAHPVAFETGVVQKLTETVPQVIGQFLDYLRCRHSTNRNMECWRERVPARGGPERSGFGTHTKFNNRLKHNHLSHTVTTVPSVRAFPVLPELVKT